MSSRVSVIVPVLNGESTILEAIRSALSQTLPVFEIIVVDNGSTDNTVALVASVADPKVKLFTCSQRGVSAARNFGINVSQGDWIAFLDADDIWNKDKNEREFLALESTVIAADIGMIFCLSNKSASFQRSSIFDVSQITAGNLVITSGVLVRSQLAKILGGKLFCECSNYAEDWGVWIKLSMQSRILFVAERLIDYSSSSHLKYDWQTIESGLRMSFDDALDYSKGLNGSTSLTYFLHRWILQHAFFSALSGFAYRRKRYFLFVSYLFKAAIFFWPLYYFVKLSRFLPRLLK